LGGVLQARKGYKVKASPETLRHLSKLDEVIDRSKIDKLKDYLFKDMALRTPFSPDSFVEKGRNMEWDYFLDEGRAGYEKLHREGMDALLTPSQKTGLEAIVLLTARPAILVQNNEFLEVPSEWQILNTKKNDINQTLQSVGRIEVSGHPNDSWLGTGFLVAENVVMTNRHVAEEFCTDRGSEGVWRFKPGMSGRIDYVEEFGVLRHAEFEIADIIGVHDIYDLSLFRVQTTSRSGVTPPPPLTISSQPPAAPEAIAGRQVFVCGYPTWDGLRNDPPVMMRIFASIFDVKRLQPGELRKFDDTINVVMHDCSTLGGNSGSCVVDLETNKVVGLHFGGRYLEGNKAVALWTMTNDPLLMSANVNFD
jgi:V8-like Glu-specific endopeptidase